MTITEIRRRLSAAYAQMTFFPRTNETYYPARWSYGDGAGDASTACKYNHRVSLAAERVASRLHLHDLDFADVTRLRDAADIIAAAYRARVERDAAVDATADDEIG
jgi:hypothetical protein